MLRKRLIFTLIYANGHFMQSRNFRLQRVGDIDWLKKNYNFQNIAFSLDELIILDASRENRCIKTFAKAVSELAEMVFIPIAAGGGIRKVEDVNILFQSGADKVTLNSILTKAPDTVHSISERYGAQSIVASIDYKKTTGMALPVIENGSETLTTHLNEHISYVQDLPIGEIYLNSINQDGTGFGYDMETLNDAQKPITKPTILAGGAGNERHLLEALQQKSVSAAATANLFNFIGQALPTARHHLISQNIDLPAWPKPNEVERQEVLL